ncbi:MAG: flagellar biosynthetic protein FliR [Alphaproteobacteria bacterium]|nr:flagellar biosynthetic protein FliR [Alphaproteobacteria bacterium]MCA0451631.1 flagellar biosynthetic protein FliR [Pseudomonadota bacterium]
MNALINPLIAILPAEAFTFFAVLVRVGAALMAMPGFGEVYVPMRIRLGAALAITAIVTPVVAGTLPPLPESPLLFAGIFAQETLVGAFIGLAARFSLSALTVAGTIIAQQGGLAAATLFDPGFGQQGTAVSSIMVATALAIIFTADIHHLLLRAMADSYTLFPPGSVVPYGDWAEAFVRWTSNAFLVGVQISAPFLVFGLIINLAMALVARLMPQMQVFFVAQPLIIAVALFALAITMSGAMFAFERGLMDRLEPLLLQP